LYGAGKKKKRQVKGVEREKSLFAFGFVTESQ